MARGLFRHPPKPQARPSRRTIGLHFGHTLYSVEDNVGGTNKSISVPSVSWLAGDLVVVVATLHDASASITGASVSGLSFEQREAEDNAVNLTASLFTAYAVGNGSGTIVITTSGAANLYAAEVIVINGVTPRVDGTLSVASFSTGVLVDHLTQIANARLYAFLVFDLEGTFVNGQNAYNIPIRQNDELQAGGGTFFRSTYFGDVGSIDVVEGWPFDGSVEVAERHIAITLSVSSTAVANLERTAADSITPSDSVIRSGTFLRTLPDSLGLADSIARQGTFLRTLADSLSLSDVVTRTGTFLRSLSDSLGLSDAVTRTGTFLRTAADSLGLSDAVARTGTFLRTAADSLSFSETVEGIKVLLRTVADALSVSDSVTRTGTFLRTLSDSLSVADAVTRAGTFARTIADAIGLSDVVSGVLSAAIARGFITVTDASIGGTSLTDSGIGGAAMNDASIGGTTASDASVGGATAGDAGQGGVTVSDE